MKKSLVLACCVMLFAATGAQSSPPDNLRTMPDRFITTSDSLRIWADFLLNPYEPTPLWVCLPQMAHTNASYNSLAEATRSGWLVDTASLLLPNVLALDLRGHGKSIVRGKDSLTFRDLSESEFARYPIDAIEVLQAVARDTSLSFQREELTIIGASIGANTAALVTELIPTIKRIVLLSPGLNYKGLQPAEAVKKFKGDILLVSSKEDEYSYQTVLELQKLNPEHSTLMIFDGSDHGTDIINNDPKAMKAVVDWLLDEETSKRAGEAKK